MRLNVTLQRYKGSSTKKVNFVYLYTNIETNLIGVLEKAHHNRNRVVTCTNLIRVLYG